MALSKPRNNMDIKITCALCSETFKSPKILPCLHTFCEPCINDFVTSFARNKPNHASSFPCPLCRSIVELNDSDVNQWAAQLPVNIVMEIIVAKTIHEMNPDCFSCKSAEVKSEAMFWCNVCDEALCSQCNIFHSRLKVSRHHRCVSIDDIAVDNRGIYVNAIHTECIEHSKDISCFCTEHLQSCCIECLKCEHTNCDSVKTIKEMTNENTYQTVPDNLKKLREAFQQLVIAKEGQKTDFRSSVKNVQEEAASFAEGLKQHIDCLLETFRKQLNVFHEEENTKMNVRLRLLEQVVKDLDHWNEVTEAVKKSGNDAQLAVLVDVSKRQLNAALHDLCSNFQSDCQIGLKFDANKTGLELRKSLNIGSFIPSFADNEISLKPIYGGCDDLHLRFYPTYENVGLRWSKSMTIKGVNMRCGTEIDQKLFIVGDVASDYKLLTLINKYSGNKVATCILEGDFRRICVDATKKRLFVSNGTKIVYVVDVHENKMNLTKTKTFIFTKDNVGALTLSDGFVYTLTSDGVKLFDPRGDAKELTQCFKSNTSTGHCGLKISDGNCFFTTSNKEVKKTTMDGKELFCYKDSAMDPISLEVLPSGSIFILDKNNNGKLRILSGDGRRQRVILGKFKKVIQPIDLWLGSEGKTVYVCGGSYIDIYDVILT